MTSLIDCLWLLLWYNSRVAKLRYLLPDPSRKILLTLVIDSSRNDQHFGKNLE